MAALRCCRRSRRACLASAGTSLGLRRQSRHGRERPRCRGPAGQSPAPIRHDDPVAASDRVVAQSHAAEIRHAHPAQHPAGCARGGHRDGARGAGAHLFAASQSLEHGHANAAGRGAARYPCASAVRRRRVVRRPSRSRGRLDGRRNAADAGRGVADGRFQFRLVARPNTIASWVRGRIATVASIASPALSTPGSPPAGTKTKAPPSTPAGGSTIASSRRRSPAASDPAASTSTPSAPTINRSGSTWISEATRRYLTDPSVSPRTMKRWPSAISSNAGIVEMTAATAI